MEAVMSVQQHFIGSDAVIVNFPLSWTPVCKVTSVETLREKCLSTESAQRGFLGLSRGTEAGIPQVPGCLL